MLKQIKLFKNLAVRSGFHYFRRAQIRPPFWISVNGSQSRVYANNEIDAVCNFCELILADCYQILNHPKSFKSLVIVDIGANVGMFSKICTLKYPNAEIYAYEPNPKSIKWLEMNSEGTNIQVFPVAVWNSLGTVKLDINCDSIDVRVSDGGNIEVMSISPEQVAEGKQIDILKLDCEGAEWQILNNYSLLKRSKYLYMEYHLNQSNTIEDMQKIIENSGHKIIKIAPKSGCANQFGMLWSKRLST